MRLNRLIAPLFLITLFFPAFASAQTTALSTDDFVLKITTTADDETFVFYTQDTDYDIDWDNDGMFEVADASGNTMYRFPTAGEHTIRFRNLTDIYINNLPGKEKYTSIEQWGTAVWNADMSGAFNGASNLMANYIDTPNMSAVTNMSRMFSRTTSFNGDISGWNIEAVTDMSNMFQGVTLSPTNYNALLIGWNEQNLQSMVTFDGGNSQYSSDAAQTARDNMMNSDRWIITDGVNQRPIFENAAFAFGIEENAVNGAEVGRVTATDPDQTSPNNVLRYAIIRDNTNAFAIDPTTGVITLASQSNLVSGERDYFLAVRATDGGTPELSATAEITITVLSSHDFVLKITTNPRNSNDRTFTFHTKDDNYSVDWENDGVFETITTGNATHTFPVAGTYTIRFTNLTSIYYSGRAGVAREKYTAIEQWGSATWENMDFAFHKAKNLRAAYTIIPNMRDVTNMSAMFFGASSFNGDISGWNTESVTNMSNMFADATSFDGNISRWNVRAVKNMGGMFNGATSFNGNISRWDTKSVTSMRSMFFRTTSFNGDISRWNVEAVKDMRFMFQQVTLSTTNYDALLIGWNKQNLQSGVRFHGGNSQYSSNEAHAARANMMAPATSASGGDGWIIIDGGRGNQAPTIEDATFGVEENVMVGAEVGRVTATDFENDAFTYAITTGNTRNTFAIDPTTGVITLASTLSQGGSSYLLTVTATEGLTPARIGTATITVNVLSPDDFVLKIRTTTDDETFVFHTQDTNYEIDWGNDGTFEVTDANGNAIHSFPLKGEHTIRFRSLNDIFINNFPGKEKYISIEQWGIDTWNPDMSNAFHGAENLIGSYMDTPNMIAVTSMENMFYRASSFNGDISGWNTASVTNMFQMLAETSFNGDISGWNVEAVTDMGFMLFGVTLSPTNYNALLIGWNEQNLQSMVTFDGGNSQYSSDAAQTARDNMMNSDGWIITDGGRVNRVPTIAASVNTLNGLVGRAIIPVTIDASAGGRVGSYEISPNIGNGLSFNAETGTISGTPVAAADEVSYTITAINGVGTDTASVDITIIMSHAGPDQTVTEGATVTLDGSKSFFSSGETPNYIWGQVDDGPRVSLNAQNIVRPTFTAPSGLEADVNLVFEFTVSTVLGDSFSIDRVTITVLAPSAPNIAASVNTLNGLVGRAIIPVTIDASTGGRVGSYKISPNIDNGLSFNAETGTISGTPVAAADKVSYTITAINGVDTATVIVDITIMSVLADAGLDQTVTEDATVTLDGSKSFFSSGETPNYIWGQVDNGAPSVSLNAHNIVRPTFTAPSGLEADVDLVFELTVSGVIFSTDRVTITVLAPSAPNIAASVNTLNGLVGRAIIPVTIDASVGGRVGSYEISPNIGSGLSFNAETGTISGTPVAAADEVSYTITAINGVGTDTAIVDITIMSALADAGPDQTVTEGATVTLDGSKSFFSGETPNYIWGQVSNGAPSVSLNAQNIVRPTFTAPSGLVADVDLVFEFTILVGALPIDRVTITVTNVNEAPVITGGNTDTVTVNENQIAVTDVTSTDEDISDNGDLFSTTLTGADASLFIITTAGVLTFNTAPNFESPTDADTNNQYIVIVTADDGNGGTDTQTITITVTNVNEDPIITSSNTFSVVEGTTDVGTLTATDPEGATPTFSITGGADQIAFTLTTAGVLTFNTAPDFESPTDANTNNQYIVMVTADDGNGGTDTQTITITVTDVNEDPIITSSNTFSVVEGTTDVGTLTATDPEGATPTFSITGGADQIAFTLTTAGVLTFNTAPDFESPTDANTNNQYIVMVTADDGNGGTDTQTITITVTDVNEDPIITSSNTFSVVEGTTDVGTLTATDPDGTTPTFSITGGADQTAFTLTTAGVLTFNTAPNFESPTDADTNNQYIVMVTATDGTLSSSAQTITITVTDVNEDPIITSSNTFSVVEGTTDVGTLTATDPEGATPTFSITGGADQIAFTLTTAGVLTFNTAPNFESPTDADTNNQYIVMVTADDGNGGTDTQTITITVTDVNEDPIITSSNTFSVVEGTTDVGTLTATDPEGATPTFSITGGADQIAFTLTTAGVLTFNTAPDFESPTDANTNNQYIVMVTADDGNGGTDTQTITITVTDVNEDPIITSSNTFSVVEGTTDVGTLTATDPDGTTPTFSITGGADQTAFTLTTAGVLTFNTAPNFESPTDADTNNQYIVMVTATDGTLSSSAQTITITVTDVNEDPIITSSNTFSVVEGTTDVGTLTATDPEGATPTFSITGGADQIAFTLTTAGVLTFNTAPNFESPTDADTNNQYIVMVTATDGTLSSSAQTITITVTDVNEDPIITSSNTFSVVEGTTDVGTLTATDPEGATPTFSITGGADQIAFTLTTAGVLTFNTAPDFESPTDANTNNQYIVMVTADDGNGGTDTQTITITVTDVNEDPIITSSNTFSVVEGTTDVGTLTATDPEGATPTFSITGGADQIAFTLTTAGVLTFNTAPDFESPTDANTNNQYIVMVTATDGTLSSSAQTITITVTDVNEDPIITSSNTFSVVEGTTDVGTLTATDPEGATPTFSITGGADQIAFTLTTAGVLTFNTAPNFESPTDADTNNQYIVMVTADDGNGGTDTQTITITVTDVNEDPIITSSNTFSVVEGTTDVGTLTATDPEGATPTFSITGGADQIAFTLTTAGVLTFNTAPDFESPTDANTNNQYIVMVTADDGNGGTDTQTITITVTDVNEDPIITSSNTFSVVEGTTDVGTLTATDPDGTTPTFSITGGADQTAFTLTTAGVLTFNTAPDFESPTDANTNNQYIVMVTADDGNGGTDTQTITITVTDVNEDPIITSSNTFSVVEGTTDVGTLTATDPDGTTPTFSITGGADQTAFTLTTAGVLTFNTAPNFESPTDADTNNQYIVMVTATDGTLSSSAQTITITVTDVNEDPIITSSNTFSVVEGTTDVGTLTATDPEGATPTFSITGGADQIAFTLTTAGVLTFNTAPNFESPTDADTNNQYIVMVTATDGTLSSSAQTITITVTDVNEDPIITSSNTFSVVEGTTDVGTLTATDPEGATPTFSITGGADQIAFTLTTAGVLTFNTAPDFESPTDANTNNQYIVMVTADDGNGGTDTQTITITVTDVNEDPIITSSNTFSVVEGTTDVGTLTATDPDGTTPTFSITGGADQTAFTLTTAGVLTFNTAPNFESPTDADTNNQYIVMVTATDGTLSSSAQTITITVTDVNEDPIITSSNTFSVVEGTTDVGTLTATDPEGATPTFSITGGADQIAFTLTTAGVLTFNTAPNFESPTDADTNNQYIVMVTATDGTLSSSAQTITITVTDVNEDPIITSSNTFSVVEGTTDVGTLTATDPEGATPTFSITGGADQIAFTLTTAGVLTFNTAPDFESPTDANTNNQYIVMVTADDGNGGTDTQTITITVTDVNEDPIITSSNTFSVVEGTTDVGTLTATDPEGATPTFSITGGADQIAFTLTTAGVLTFNTAPDFESPTDANTNNQYIVMVTADDGNGGTDTQTITITVTDVNEDPIITSSNTFSVVEGTTDVGTLTATDPDGTTPTFSITGGADQTAFTLTTAGVLTFNTAPNFESPTDADTNNQYIVMVTATDGTLSSSAQTITITVTDVNEDPIITSSNTFSVVEGTTDVGTLTATDPEGATPTFSITGGADQIAFTLTTAGVLTFNTAPNFESPTDADTNNQYIVMVTADDGNGGTDTQTITITVTDVNEDPIITSSNTFSVVEGTTDVGTLTATDPEGATPTFSITGGADQIAFTLTTAGVLTFNTAPDFESPTDANTNNQYIVMVTADDGNGGTDTQTITITVTDVNEDPIITSSNTFSVVEGTTDVGTLTATDPDGTTPTFSITGGADQTAFTLTTAGVLTFNTAPNFESPTDADTNNQYIVMVTATDGTLSSSAQTITITVTDVNEDPIITSSNTFSVVEGTTDVGTLTATDPEGATPTFSITGGADQIAFTLTTAGVLTFNTAPNFESPTDADTNNQYIVMVTATDGTLSSSAQTITITVTDVNEDPIITSSNTFSVVEGTTDVGTLTATDPEGATPTFSITGGADQIAFTLTTAGVLTFNTAPDFESPTDANTNNQYIVMVTADDGNGGTDTQTITITVTDVNEDPIITSSNTFSVVEGTTDVGTLTATDPEGATPTFSITGGADQIAFTLTTAGVLTFNTAPDFESPTDANTNNQYIVMVTADDGNGGTDTQTITITVTDVNEDPIITSSNTFSVVEGTTDVGTLTATDPDGTTPTFSITGGADQTAFTLTTAGVLTFNTAPNFESPTDADTNNQYIVMVTATDGTLSSSAQTITITVTDVNEDPIITSSNTFSVVEGTTDVGTLTATDPEGATPTFSITGGADQIAFTLTTAGVLTFNTAPNFESPTDADTNNQYIVMVTATDGTLSSSAQTITITVTDVNEDPIITSSNTFSVVEGTTDVGTLTATDPEGATPTFSITGGADQIAFTLTTAGVLTFNTAPDFESPTDANTNNQYIVMVTADDGNGGTDTQTITITVTDVNEDPIITSSNTFSVVEGTTDVGTLTATDPEGATPTFSITGGADQIAFTLTTAGVLTFNTAPDFESPTDANTNNQYIVMVTADDGNGGTDTQTITITVTDVNEDPIITSSNTFSVVEGTTDVGTLTATDPDGTTPTFSITGGADQTAFTLTTAGVLTFNTAPNFESPTDADTNNQYIVMVTATDGTLSSSAQTITITVTDVNEDPIITSSNTFSVVEGTTDVGTLTATDPEGATPTFSITGGADQIAFTLTTAGVLTFNTAPNFESPTDADTNNQYIVMVTADDGNGGTDTQTITITVTDVNEDPIITSSNTFSVVEGTTDVGTLTATDPEGATPTFSITGGADQIAFTLTTAGVLTFNTAPDFESPTDANTNNQYIVMVTADDGNGGTDTQTITITVTDVNEDPIITSSNTFSVVEGTTDVGTLTATDPDGTTPTFSITGGADQTAFTLTTAGVLTFNTAPNFESPTDADTNNQYIVMVTATDGTLSSSAQTITITVTDVNEDPIITSSNTFSVVEGTTDVGTLTATDPEGATPTFSITGGADQIAFTLTTAGVLTFNTAPNFESPTDADTNNQYIVMVTATDGTLSSSAQTITITVTDVNEDPIITSSNTFSVVEGTTDVGTLTATDPEGATPTFSITGGADQIAFTLTTAGVLTFNTAPDFESPTDANTNNQYIVMVTADDGNGGTDTQTITITVTDVNEDPIITSSNTFSVVEGTTDVGTLTATDPEGATPTFSITGGADQIAFTLTTAGVLTFNTAPDFESPTDANTNNQYIVMVTATDGTLSSSAQTITITVTDVNEDPIITSSNTFSVVEGTTDVGTLTATDPEGATPTFSITGGADQIAFTLTTAGVLTFNTAPNFESPTDADTNNQYIVMVTADDGNGGTDTQTITITVTDVNEDPIITSSNTFSVVEGTTDVGTLTATDPEGATPTFSITGGADQIAFTLTTAGVLTFNTAPDFESPTDANTNNQYIVMVTADDGNGGTDTQTITITVTDVNEDPIITSSNTFSVVEGTTDVGTLTATDPDGTTPTFSITGGADQTAFTLTTAGVLTFNTAPDFESPTDANTNNQYIVMVTADDGNGGTDTQTITITVTDVNEDPIITSSNTFSVVEGTTDVGTLTATDPDGTTPTFSITGGADQTAFTLTTAGVLTFNTAPNFESPTDADTNNQYIVMVTATDGTLSSSAQTITITVTDVNEDPIITSSNTFSVVEGTTDVGTLTATDPEGATPTFSITGGADQIAFTLTTAGVLTFNTAPNFESPTDADTNNQYIVMVTATDGTLSSSAQTITITVTDVNEDPIITSSNTFSVVEGTTDVGTLTATDPEGATPTFSITGGADQIAFTLTTAGVLTFNTAPDFESPTDANTNNQYIVMVTADDGNGGTDTQTITITVTDVNEDPIITSSNTFSVVEGTTDVGTLTATDPDGTTPTFSITGGADQTAFTLTTAGVLTFNTAPNFESPTDADTNNQYIVMVTATDGTLSSSAQTITITVTDVNEDPIITSSSTFTVQEGTTDVGTFTATDPEGATPTFSITGGADQIAFTLTTAGV